jgi:hypothetical protein
LQSTRIASKFSSVFLLVVLSVMCAIGCGGAGGATRSNGGTPPTPTPNPTATPTPTPAPPGSPSLTATPSSLGFGSQAINTPVTLTVKVTNNGSGAANITKDGITGAGFSAGITFPINLNPAQSVNVPIVFTPAASGSVAGNFTLTSSTGATLLTVPLSGTGFTPTPHTVDIAWSASTSTLQGYNVYRSTTSGGPYSKISTSISATTLLFTDTTPQSGKKYFYVVTAVATNGVESTASTEVAVTIPTP